MSTCNCENDRDGQDLGDKAWKLAISRAQYSQPLTKSTNKNVEQKRRDKAKARNNLSRQRTRCSPIQPGKKGSKAKGLLFVGWLLNVQQQASVSQGRICSDNFACCHTEIDVADPTFYLTQSQYTDTGPTSPSADHIAAGQECQFLNHWYDSTPKKSRDLPLSKRTP